MQDSRGPEEGKKNFWFESASMTATGAWAEKRRLASALREVCAALARTDASEQQLATAADTAEHLAGILRGGPRREGLTGFAEAATAGDVGAFFDQSPLIGLSNPLAPPMSLECDGDRVRGRVVFGPAYEGPPGHVHGGFVAAAFDEALGFAQSLTGNPGMTGTLTIRYRRPTPLGAELRVDAGVDRVEGRKIFASGRLVAGTGGQESVTAEAEAVFVSVDADRFRSLVEGKA